MTGWCCVMLAERTSCVVIVVMQRGNHAAMPQDLGCCSTRSYPKVSLGRLASARTRLLRAGSFGLRAAGFHVPSGVLESCAPLLHDTIDFEGSQSNASYMPILVQQVVWISPNNICFDCNANERIILPLFREPHILYGPPRAGSSSCGYRMLIMTWLIRDKRCPAMPCALRQTCFVQFYVVFLLSQGLCPVHMIVDRLIKMYGNCFQRNSLSILAVC